MSIKSIIFPVTGLADAVPSLLYINTDDTLATVTTTGYLDQAKPIYGNIFSNYQMAIVYTSDIGGVILRVLISADGANASLESTAEAGLIALPTVTNQITYATNTLGALAASGATRIFNAGGIDAGLSGVAGSLRSYPATALNGYLEIFGTANGAARNVTVTNVAHGQTSAYSIPDCGNAVGRLLVGATATPFATGRVLSSSGTGGLVADSGVTVASLATYTGSTVGGNIADFNNTTGQLIDSGVALTAVQLKANIKAATTANIGGAGAGPLSVVVAGLTTASVVVATIESSSNPASVIACTATGTGFDVTLSADPGANCLLNYVACIAAQ